MSNRPQRTMVIAITLLIAAVLSILPLPVALEAWRPEWVLCVLLYWVVALPHRVNIGTAFVIGLLVDVLLGSTLGVRALAFSVVTYIAAANFHLIRNFSVWQQALIVGALLLLGKFVVFWAEHLAAAAIWNLAFFFSPLPSMLIWPWLFLLLRRVRRQFQVS